MIIKIDKVENKLKKTDNSLYLKINGMYSCFENSFFDILNNGVGKSYEMEIATSPDGKWKNIRGVGEEVKKEGIEVVKMNTPTNQIGVLDKDEQIRRAVALKGAVDHCVNTQNTEITVLLVADAFLNWLKK